MNMRDFLVVVSLGFFAHSSYAFINPVIGWGGEVGNGCAVVSHYDENQLLESVETLDYFEAAVLRKIYYSLGDSNLLPMEKATMVFKRLSRLDLKRATEYQEKANRFFFNANMIPGVLLTKTEDWGYVVPVLPVSAKIEQLVIQKQPIFPEDRLYTINKDLWDRLDNDQRAGVIIHEIVYEEAIQKYAHKDSVNTRYFVGLISSDKLNFSSNLTGHRRFSPA